MPWGRLDDGLYDHPKLHDLGRDRLPAIGLWTLAVSWCNRRLTDGHIPAKRVGLLGGSRRLAQRLVEVGMFEVDGTDYRVHDFLDFNDSREQVLTRREAAAERQRRHRTNGADVTPSSQRESHRDNQRDKAAGHAVTEALVTAPPRAPTRARPGPARPTPKEEEGSPVLESRPANGKATRSVNGFSSVGSVVSDFADRTEDWKTSLTLAEKDEWSSFGPDWDAFKVAWMGRGFRHPPSGQPDDDPDAPNPSQRALLWSILDAWPNEMPRWIVEAPKTLITSSMVVAHLIERWHGKRDEGVKRSAEQVRGARASKADETIPTSGPVATYLDDL